MGDQGILRQLRGLLFALVFNGAITGAHSWIYVRVLCAEVTCINSSWFRKLLELHTLQHKYIRLAFKLKDLYAEGTTDCF